MTQQVSKIENSVTMKYSRVSWPIHFASWPSFRFWFTLIVLAHCATATNVLEFYFSTYLLTDCNKFGEVPVYVRNCPHINCDLITDAGGQVIPKSQFSNSDSGFGAITMEEFLAGPLKWVDVVIYTNNFQAIEQKCPTQLSEVMGKIPAYQSGHVYDVFKTVYNGQWGLGTDYFEGFVAEPDIALLEMISILTPQLSRTGFTRKYYRKAVQPNKEEQEFTSSSQCDNPNQPLYNDWYSEPCNTDSNPVVINGLEGVAHECKSSPTLHSDRNYAQCICNNTFDASVDYFPYKVSPDFSKFWQVEYFKHYKIIHDQNLNVTFYLNQCGAPTPPNMPSDAVLINIPVKSVAVGSTTFFHFFDYLGHLPSISYLQDGKEASDPCILKLIEDGSIKYDPTTLINETDIEVLYISNYFYNSSISHAGNQKKLNTNAAVVVMDSDLENSMEARAEWVEFVSLFFNREQAANHVVSSIKDRYDCQTENVNEYLKAGSAGLAVHFFMSVAMIIVFSMI